MLYYFMLWSCPTNSPPHPKVAAPGSIGDAGPAEVVARRAGLAKACNLSVALLV